MKNSNLSFEAIRNAMAAKVSGIPVIAQVSSSKVVEVAKSVGTAIKGILPVTQNQLDDRTTEILRMVVATSMDLTALRNQIGFVAPELNHDHIDAVTSQLLAAMKGAPARVEVKETQPLVLSALGHEILGIPMPAVAPVVPVPAPVASGATPNMSITMEPEEPAQKASPAVSPLMVQLSEPTNWHQQ